MPFNNQEGVYQNGANPQPMAAMIGKSLQRTNLINICLDLSGRQALYATDNQQLLVY